MWIVLVTLAQGRRGVADLPLELGGLPGEVSLLRRGRGEGAEASLVPGPGHEVLLVLVSREVAGAGVVVAHGTGRGSIQTRVMEAAPRIPGPGHEPELVHPLLFAPLVLEPDLDDPHAQAGVLGQLLPHQPGGFGIIIEDILQHF